MLTRLFRKSKDTRLEIIRCRTMSFDPKTNDLNFTPWETGEMQAFKKCSILDLTVSRDWLKGVEVGDKFNLNGKHFTLESVFDPYPNENEWGFHYVVKATFKRI